MCAFGICAVAVDLRVAHEHVCAWDADVCEDGVAHVCAVKAHLQADVAGFDAREILACRGRAERYDEGVDAVILAREDELGHDDAMSGGEAESAGPVFGAGEGGRVYNELVGLGVECRCSFEAADEGSVAELGLGVCADDLARVHEGHPVGSLLRAGLQAECSAEH